MKTHGLVMDQENSKMSKSRPQHTLIDPTDLLLGSVKLSGQRLHGFGPDVLRLWAANHDTDKVFGVEIDDFKDYNDQVNMFRQICRQMLSHLFEFKVASQRLQFGQLNRIDQITLILLAEHLKKQRETMDSQLDVRKYIAEMQKFAKERIADFYVELLKNRMLFHRGTQGFHSAQTTLLLLLQSLIIQASPVLMYTAQEVFQHMPEYLFADKKPLTVFQMAWPAAELYSEDMVKILENF